MGWSKQEWLIKRMGTSGFSRAASGVLLLYSVSWAASAELRIQLRDADDTVIPAAVVYLLGGNAPLATATQHAVIDQQDKQFVPAVTAIQTGTEVEFPNSDAVSHHVYSFAQPNSFELPLYKQTQRPVVRFDHSGVVTLGCNIHDSMLGYVVVVDTPWFGFTETTGELVLPDLPPGRYDAYVWSRRLDPTTPLPLGPIVVDSQTGTATRVLTTTHTLRSEPPAATNALSWSEY